MSSHAVQIQIVGRTLRVNCPEGQDVALKNAAVDFNKRIKELQNTTKMTSIERLLMFSALNVCFELNELETENLKLKQALDISQKQINQLQQQEKNAEQCILDCSKRLNQLHLKLDNSLSNCEKVKK